MTALDRKLWRELWRLRGQMLSIALVVATGMMAVVTMRGTSDSLSDAQARYYRRTRFATVWASVKRAPESLRLSIEEIPGVATVDTRVTFVATLDLPGREAPGIGRFVSLPASGRPLVNDIVVVRGRYLAPGDRDAVIISKKFAAARHLGPGDSVAAVINGRARTVRVVGVAISPEHVYSVPPGSLVPDDSRYGVFWMSRDVLGPAYDLAGAFNEVVLTLEQDADPPAVIARVDRLLEPYGGLGAYGRKDQFSHQLVQGELDSNRAVSTTVPAVFLGVAAFLLNLVLGRLITTQRTEIAVLKAFGYSDRRIGMHFLQFALAAAAAGIVAGVAAGVWLGHQYVVLYSGYFDFPDLHYQLNWRLVALASAASVVGAALGAWTAVRRAVELPPAEAMRPEPPARFTPGWLERLGVVRGRSAAVRMILRNVGRHPGRPLFSALGVAFSVAILVIGMFVSDGINFMLTQQFRVIQREDLSVAFTEPLPATVRYSLAQLPGVERVELFHSAPARIHAGHRWREVSVQGEAADARMRRIVSAEGAEQALSANGVVLDAILADKLRVAVQDTVRVELLVGTRHTAPFVVTGVVKTLLGVSAYMTDEMLQHLEGGAPVATGAYLRVASDQRSALNARLKALPAVADVGSRSAMLASFQSKLADSLSIEVVAMLVFAGVLAVGVIYNGARVALSERGRELASLRVMGFRRGEVAVLLLGQQAGVTALAIPLGWLLGYALSVSVAAGLQSDVYRIPMVVSARTYVLSAAITALAAGASAMIVRRRVDHLDLVAVLKTRE